MLSRNIRFKILFLLILTVPLVLKAQTKKNNGYFNITEFGYHYIANGNIKAKLPSGNFNITMKGEAYSLRTINGFFLNPHFSLGLGAGIEGKSNYYDLFPIFLDFRGYLKDARNTPYAYVDAGYAPEFGVFEKAWVANLGVGYKFFIGKRTCLVAGAEINYARKDRILEVNFQKENQYDYYESKNVKLNQHTLSFKLGFLF